MKIRLAQAFIGVFLAVLLGAQAVANSQIKEDFAYAFGSSDGLDSGNIRPLSPSEMNETEGLFISWLIRMGPRLIREVINVLDIVGTRLVEWRKKRVDVWIRVGNSSSITGGFKTRAIRWGSNRFYRDQKLKNSILRELNRRLHETRIPIRSWRTNDPGHLHIKKLPPRAPDSGPSSPSNRPSSLSSRLRGPIISPELHGGEGGIISSIDWEIITAEDLLTGIYSESLLTEAAAGPLGTGREARRWGMEELTEKQAMLGLSILVFITDPQNNVDIDIPLESLWKHQAMAIYLRKNPRKNGRIAKMAKLGLKQLEYIISQHNQGYHPPEQPPTAVALAASADDALTVDPAPMSAPEQNSYLPVQAHWWMHRFDSR